jgi:diadenosine tetraphosphate (Ap4A) HIT family hydrolase
MCVFCKVKENKENIIYEDNQVYAIYDVFPVSKGHVLVITKRHIDNYFDTTNAERDSISLALFELKKMLDLRYAPNGYNIGINNGIAAGQTIMHLHVHLIPRYQDDVEDPRGGVRGVIPNKQKY